MPLQKTNSNIVVAAKSLNPTIFSQLWFVREKILSDDDFISPMIFTPITVEVRTKDFQLLVIPDRLQLTFSSDLRNKSEIIKNIIGNIVRKLPHTPFIALGFNISYNFFGALKENLLARNKELLFCSSNPLHDFFNSPDVRFGFYCSKDFYDMRLKLDMKPMSAPITSEEHEEFFNFNFNFHIDLNEENKIEQICSSLEKWNLAEKHCIEIFNFFESKWTNKA